MLPDESDAHTSPGAPPVTEQQTSWGLSHLPGKFLPSLLKALTQRCKAGGAGPAFSGLPTKWGEWTGKQLWSHGELKIATRQKAGRKEGMRPTVSSAGTQTGQASLWGLTHPASGALPTLVPCSHSPLRLEPGLALYRPLCFSFPALVTHVPSSHLAVTTHPTPPLVILLGFMPHGPLPLDFSTPWSQPMSTVAQAHLHCPPIN